MTEAEAAQSKANWAKAMARMGMAVDAMGKVYTKGGASDPAMKGSPDLTAAASAKLAKAADATNPRGTPEGSGSSSATGGASSIGGSSSATGGASSIGGSSSATGGASSIGGSSSATGGASSIGGSSSATGGASSIGGASPPASLPGRSSSPAAGGEGERLIGFAEKLSAALAALTAEALTAKEGLKNLPGKMTPEEKAEKKAKDAEKKRKAEEKEAEKPSASRQKWDIFAKAAGGFGRAGGAVANVVTAGQEHHDRFAAVQKGIKAAQGIEGLGSSAMLGAASRIAGLAGGPVGIAVAGVVAGATAFAGAVKSMTDESIAAASKLAQVSGTMAAVMAERHIREVFRDIGQAEKVAGTTRQLAQSEQKFKDATEPIESAIMNIKNTILSPIYDTLTTMLVPITFISELVNEWLRGGPTPDTIGDVLKRIADETEAAKKRGDRAFDRFDFDPRKFRP